MDRGRVTDAARAWSAVAGFDDVSRFTAATAPSSIIAVLQRESIEPAAFTQVDPRHRALTVDPLIDLLDGCHADSMIDGLVPEAPVVEATPETPAAAGRRVLSARGGDQHAAPTPVCAGNTGRSGRGRPVSTTADGDARGRVLSGFASIAARPSVDDADQHPVLDPPKRGGGRVVDPAVLQRWNQLGSTSSAHDPIDLSPTLPVTTLRQLAAGSATSPAGAPPRRVGAAITAPSVVAVAGVDPLSASAESTSTPPPMTWAQVAAHPRPDTAPGRVSGLRGLVEHWNDPLPSTGQPGHGVGLPTTPNSVEPAASTTSGRILTRSSVPGLDRPPFQLGTDISPTETDVEALVLSVLERGLRSEARRHGIDPDDRWPR